MVDVFETVQIDIMWPYFKTHRGNLEEYSLPSAPTMRQCLLALGPGDGYTIEDRIHRTSWCSVFELRERSLVSNRYAAKSEQTVTFDRMLWR